MAENAIILRSPYTHSRPHRGIKFVVNTTDKQYAYLGNLRGGSLYYDSGNESAHGTLNSFTDNKASWRNTDWGMPALQFTGSEYVSIPGINLQSNYFVVYGFVKWVNNPAWDHSYIFDIQDNVSSARATLGVYRSTGELAHYDGEWRDSGLYLTENQWHFVALIKVAFFVILYVDAASSGTVIGGPSNLQSAATAAIGSRFSYDRNFWIGEIGDIFVRKATTLPPLTLFTNMDDPYNHGVIAKPKDVIGTRNTYSAYDPKIAGSYSLPSRQSTLTLPVRGTTWSIT